MTDRQGFTIIEVIVVAAIVGILAAFAVGYYSDSMQTARENSARQSLQNVRQSISQYFKSRMEYPDNFKKLGMGDNPSKTILDRLGDSNAKLFFLVPGPTANSSNPIQIPACSMTYVLTNYGSMEYLGTDGKAQQFSDVKISDQTVATAGKYGSW